MGKRRGERPFAPTTAICPNNIEQMHYDPEIHHRRSIRLKEYDYSKAGAYFVTICTWDKKCILGEIDGEKMKLDVYGKIVFEEWHRSSEIRKEIGMDAFVIMPNHIHGIVIIHDTTIERMKPKSISSFIAGFKSAVTKRINQIRNTPGFPVWQRNYYEHVIRNEKELNAIREYIAYNPLRWNEDTENPNRKPKDKK